MRGFHEKKVSVRESISLRIRKPCTHNICNESLSKNPDYRTDTEIFAYRKCESHQNSSPIFSDSDPTLRTWADGSPQVNIRASCKTSAQQEEKCQ